MAMRNPYLANLAKQIGRFDDYMKDSNRDLYLAKLAKKVGRFDDMKEYMEKIACDVASADAELTTEECNLLSESYENVVRSRLSVLMNISSFEEVPGLRIYQYRIESEISTIYRDIFSFIDSILIPMARNPESKVLYFQQKADYCSRLIEFKAGSERRKVIDNILSFYKAAQDIAETELEPAHPIRLNLALKLSKFYFEVLNSPKKAETYAKKTYDDAIADLTAYREQSFRDSFLVIHLLGDQLDSWKSKSPDADDGDP